jgi:hypothetical protein
MTTRQEWIDIVVYHVSPGPYEAPFDNGSHDDLLSDLDRLEDATLEGLAKALVGFAMYLKPAQTPAMTTARRQACEVFAKMILDSVKSMGVEEAKAATKNYFEIYFLPNSEDPDSEGAVSFWDEVLKTYDELAQTTKTPA